MQARVSRKLHDRLEGHPQIVRDSAIAREMVGFLGAIAGQTQIGSAT